MYRQDGKRMTTMAKPRWFGELEIGYDPAYEEREWKVNRAAWILMFLFSVASSAGLFGDGPVSGKQTGTPGAPLRVKYEKFVRKDALTELKVHVQTAPSELFTLGFDREYLEQFRIHRITPQPVEESIVKNRSIFAFKGSGDISLEIESKCVGGVSTGISLNGGEPLHLKQFCWP